jgi:MATE family multidrug resistance protein
MVIQVITTIIHPFWCYLFVHVWELGIKGPALATSVSTVLNILLLSIYLSRIESFKEMWFLPNAECLKGLKHHITLGLNSMGLIWLEWCAFELLVFMSGFLVVDSTGAQIILFNFECLIFMPAMALQIATSAKVGKEIGAGNVVLAKRYAKLA